MAAAASPEKRRRGGPLIRYGGKGLIAPLLVAHFPRALVYAEPFFGGGSVFFALAPGTYARQVVNDLDGAIVTFFRVLRDRPDDLARVCAATPFARAEFAACLAHSDDDLEEARRVWVRSRQSVSGIARSPGNWAREPGRTGAQWRPLKTETKLGDLRAYAARLRAVAIDCVPALEFIAHWGHDDTFVYADPPYVHATRADTDAYAHEMGEADHVALAAALHAAEDRGAKVALSGYPSTLYDGLYGGWRRVEIQATAPSASRSTTGQRRTEVLWMSYPATAALGYSRQTSLGLGGSP
jgi:DNA adenine methylase